MAIKDWNSTPSSNTNISGINIAEGCAPSGINDAIRQMMADVKNADFGTTAPKADAIAESTSGAGVTIDGLLIKDGAVSGMVSGPASATDGTLARYDGTTGKLLKDGVPIGASGGVQAYDADTAKTDVAQAYTAQQYAAPVTHATTTGSVALDADLHQDVEISATGNVTLGAPSNSAKGKTIFLTLYAASALTITWNAVFKGNADNSTLDAAFVAGKRIFMQFRCIDGTNWVLMGRAQEA